MTGVVKPKATVFLSSEIDVSAVLAKVLSLFNPQSPTAMPVITSITKAKKMLSKVALKKIAIAVDDLLNSLARSGSTSFVIRLPFYHFIAHNLIINRHLGYN